MYTPACLPHLSTSAASARTLRPADCFYNARCELRQECHRPSTLGCIHPTNTQHNDTAFSAFCQIENPASIPPAITPPVALPTNWKLFILPVLADFTDLTVVGTPSPPLATAPKNKSAPTCSQSTAPENHSGLVCGTGHTIASAGSATHP